MKKALLLAALAATLLPSEELAPYNFKPQQKRWWAVQPVAKPALPEAAFGAVNEIDRFVFDQLKA